MISLTMYCIVPGGTPSAAGGNCGKMLTQAGHTYLHAYVDAATRFPAAADAYRLSEAQRKVVVITDGEGNLAAHGGRVSGLMYGLIGEGRRAHRFPRAYRDVSWHRAHRGADQIGPELRDLQALR